MKNKPIPDWAIRTKADEQFVANGGYWDDRLANKIVKFIETFCIQRKGQWRNKAPKLLPFQKERIIYPLYSWKNADGSNRFNMAIITGPKKFGA